MDQRRDDLRNLRDHKQNVEGERDRDEGHRFQDADAQEHEEEDVGSRLWLSRDRFDRFRGYGAVADRRAERDPGDDDAEADHRRRCN